MAYVQVLALVLCSLFIQDALSEVRGSQRTAAAGGVNGTPATRVLKRSATAPAPTKPAVPIIKRAASTGGARAGSEPVVGARKRARTVPAEEPAVTKTARRIRSVKAAMPPPPPPPKYPNLARAEAMAWDVAEEVNRTNESGKLMVRSVRNAIGELLTNHLFWNTLVANIRRRAKLTNNPVRAGKLIENSKTLTSLMTGPMAARGLETLADDVYEAAVMVEPCTDALWLATEVAKGEQVIEGLQSASFIVQHVQVDPALVRKAFDKITKFIQSGGAMVMSQGMASGLLTVSSRMQRQPGPRT